jgi:hypothetical protein
MLVLCRCMGSSCGLLGCYEAILLPFTILRSQCDISKQGAAPPGAGNPGLAGSLDFLRESPQFQTLRQIVQASPGILQPMLQVTATDNLTR